MSNLYAEMRRVESGNKGDVWQGAGRRLRHVHQDARRAYRDMFKLVRAAERSGMGRLQIIRTLRSSSVSRADAVALLNERIPRFKLTPLSRSRALSRARSLYDADAVDRIRRRYRAVRAFSRSGI